MSRGRESIRFFAESLPSPRSRLAVVGTVVVGIVLAQALVSGIAEYLFLKGNDPGLVDALGAFGPEPTVSGVGALLRALSSANLELWFAFTVGVMLSAYFIARPLATGYRISRLVLERPDGLGAIRRGAELTETLKSVRMRQREADAFAALRADAPTELPFDLVVKALLAVAVLFLGLYGERTSLVDPADRWKFRIFIVAAALRLAYLAWVSRRRDGGLAWLALPVTIACIAGSVAVPIDEFAGSDEVPTDRELALSLSLRRDLSGVDLRRRDLRHFFLHGKDLSNANLTGADLSGANLSRARLRGADLTEACLANADLSGADLRGAIFFATAMDSAVLDGADLRSTELQGFLGTVNSDRRTRWPGGRGPPNNSSQFVTC